MKTPASTPPNLGKIFFGMMFFLFVFAISDNPAWANDTLAASHSLPSGTYASGSEVTVTTRIEYTGTLISLGMAVNLPNGWSYVPDGGDAPDVRVSDTGDLEIFWLAPPISPVEFEYKMRISGLESNLSRQISARVLYIRSSDGELVAAAQPDPLHVSISPDLTGDMDGDGSVSLADVIIVLRTLTGSGTVVKSESDISGDNQTGNEEAVYILKRLAMEGGE